MLRKFLFCVIFLIFNNLLTNEFLYPVAVDNSKIYLIHQKSLYSIDLLIWDIETNQIQKNLLSIFLPGGLKLLPNSLGFSFIDQGKLRIKYFNKRSPKTVNFNEPIYDLSNIDWIDENNCYFSAKRRNNFCIFQYDLKEKKLHYLKEKKGIDFFYPQKILSQFFCIKRLDEKYKIIKFFNDTEEVILDLNNTSIAFLNMISENEGFFLEHVNLLDRENQIIPFIYWRIFKEDFLWKKEKLFNFNLPIHYLFGNNDQRLYESILPFLPKYYDAKIYFCSCAQEDLTVNIYSFELLNKKIENKVTLNYCCFSPIVFKDKVFYGGIIKKINKNEKNAFFLNYNDQLILNLPSFKI